MWVEVGKGVRYSRLIPLSVLPPGETITMEVMVHNSGPSVVGATYYISLTDPNLQGMRLSGESLDLPPGAVFDITHGISTALLPGDYSLTMFCIPHPPSAPATDPNAMARAQQNTAAPPPLVVMDGNIPHGLPGLYGVLKVRTSLVCPSCRGMLLWASEGVWGRPRGWACGRCGYRLETGML
jgi:ribosomal protein S27AE